MQALYELDEALDNVESALFQVVDAAEDASRIADRIGGEVKRTVGGQIESYLKATAKSFAENRNQAGSVASLRRIVQDEMDYLREGEQYG